MKYRVKLTREVCDLLVCYLEVEAENADAAGDAVLKLGPDDLDWQPYVCDPDPAAPEVDGVEEIREGVAS